MDRVNRNRPKYVPLSQVETRICRDINRLRKIDQPFTPHSIRSIPKITQVAIVRELADKLLLDHPRHLRSKDFHTKLDGWKANLWKFYEFYRSQWPADHKGSAIDYMLDVLGIEKEGSAQQQVPVDAGRSEAELLEGARKKKYIGIKSLSEEEIQALAYRAGEGDRESIDILVYCFEPLLQSCANGVLRKFPRSRLKADDLMQQGRIFLSRLVTRYDPLKASLVRYATRSLDRLFVVLIFRDTGVIHIPANQLLQTGKLQKTERTLKDELGRGPTDEEVADKMGITIEEYKEIVRFAEAAYLEDEIVEEGKTLMEIIPDNRFPPPDSGPGLLQKLEAAIQGSDLTEREIYMIREFFFELRTEQEIGKEFQITRQAVSYAIKMALIKVRQRRFGKALKELLS